jgi:hypothetical protein
MRKCCEGMPCLISRACHAGTCSAACGNGFCSQSATVASGATATLFTSSCTPGTALSIATLTQLVVESSDNSMFNVYTSDVFSTTDTYALGTAKSVQCFQMPASTTIGQTSNIVVMAQCLSSTGCPLVWGSVQQCRAAPVTLRKHHMCIRKNQ